MLSGLFPMDDAISERRSIPEATFDDVDLIFAKFHVVDNEILR